RRSIGTTPRLDGCRWVRHALPRPQGMLPRATAPLAAHLLPGGSTRAKRAGEGARGAGVMETSAGRGRTPET
ncbi:MAG: hypothetical protein ACO3WM_12510, partial [Gemmobacter sp.]